MEGGPLGPGGKQPGERPMSGTVTFTAAGHQPITVKVGSSGTFSVPLPPGRYQVSGRSADVMEIDGGHSREAPCSQPTLGRRHRRANRHHHAGLRGSLSRDLWH